MARVRRQRSTTESLLSIVLALEVFLVFFATLTVFALRSVDATVALVGGGVFIVILLVASRLVRHPAGQVFGWVLQVALVLTGILVPLMYFIGAGFLALYAFCYIKGRSLDRERQELEKTL